MLSRIYSVESGTFQHFQALLQVCTENIARGGMMRDKYSTRQS